jgi:hypothetical protein
MVQYGTVVCMTKASAVLQARDFKIHKLGLGKNVIRVLGGHVNVHD